MTDQVTLGQAEIICQTLREEDDGVRREVLTHAGSRWSLGILHALGVYGTMRHAEIKRQMAGVTQRMLTKTLRSLERDGLLIRRELDQVPPHVEYELTPLGMGLLTRMSPIWTWVVENVDDFREARRTFDSQGDKKPSWQIPVPMAVDRGAAD
ncbi:helix-turn-helix transcriptional regulator [Pseudomonas sp. SWRI18]|uniref:winged helix-turn-helix transcriptional regulator n=1 Tax=Pseudomonas sp. SWRI18 TaxID=2753888 RepID=UPI0016485686|nr:helix-turn-helix domain-containing protein [Pseudomonas sp. SWRI18]MBC3300090.1 helix-turn-helix transcriptional regulator [Pseudomonas sp. SWRI18]